MSTNQNCRTRLSWIGMGLMLGLTACLGCSRDDCADGCGYLAEGKFDRAIAAFDLAIANNPKNALAIYYRATVYQKQGRIEKEQGGSRRSKAGSRRRLRRNDREAMRDYEEAIRLHKEIAGAGKAQPNAVPLGTAELYDAYLNLGAHFHQAGDLDRAIRNYTDAIDVAAKCADAYCGRGAVYYEIGRYNLAIDDYTKAIAFVPRSSNADEEAAEGARLARKRAEGYLGRGTAYLAKGFPDLAFGDLTEAQHLDPTSQQALWQRAIAGLKLGRVDPAIDDCPEGDSVESEVCRRVPHAWFGTFVVVTTGNCRRDCPP